MGPFGIMEFLFFFVLIGIVVATVAVTLYVASSTRRRQEDALMQEIGRQFASQRQWMEERLHSVEEHGAPPAPPQPAAPPPPKISEDKLMILGAVLACHFGKRVKIRTARVISVGSGTNVWSQQGRAAVQASHTVVR